MKLRLIPLTALLLPAFALPIAAQVSFPLADARSISWPSGTTGPLNMGRAAVAELTGDKHLEFLIQHGNSLSFAYGVSIHSHVGDVSVPELSSINDFTIMPGALPDGRDEIVLVGPEGGYRLALDYDEPTDFEARVFSDSTWNGAQRVEYGDINRDGLPDLVGIGFAGNLLVKLGPLSDGQPPFTATLGVSVDDLVPIDWTDTDSPDYLEIAAAVPGVGIVIYNAFGVPLQIFPATIANAQLQVFRQDGYAFDRLAMLYDLNATQYLGVVHAPNVNDFPENLGPAGTYGSFAAGDIDDDGDDDVVVTREDMVLARVFFNQSDGNPPTLQTFDTGGGASEDNSLTGVGASVISQLWEPVLADVDRDGDLDLLAPHDDASPTVRVFPGSAIDHTEQKPTVLAGTYDYLESDPDKHGELSLVFWEDPYDPLDDPRNNLSFTPTHLQVIGWTQPNWLVGETMPDLDLDALYFYNLEIDDALTGENKIRINDDDEYTDQVFNFELTYVEIDPATDEVLNASPSSAWVFSSYKPVYQAVLAVYGSTVSLITPAIDGDASTSVIQDRVEYTPGGGDTGDLPPPGGGMGGNGNTPNTGGSGGGGGGI
ncbi:MAG: hypothetical protein AAF682_31290 [Planctomycetota bacterium]